MRRQHERELQALRDKMADEQVCPDGSLAIFVSGRKRRKKRIEKKTRKEKERKGKKRGKKEGRKEKRREEKKRKETKRNGKKKQKKDYAFRRKFDWKPSIIPGPACVTLVSPPVCESTDKMAGERVSLALSNAIVMSVCLSGCPSGYRHVCLLACLSVRLSVCLSGC